MAEATWYCSLSSGTYLGNEWQAYTLNNSWNTLPAEANITNIKYYVDSYVGSYTTQGSWVFQLYGIAVNNGPYTGAAYSTTSKPSSKVGSITASLSSSSDTGIHDYDFQGGEAQVYGENIDSDAAVERTHCDLVGCTFANTTNTSAFSNSSISVKLRFNNSKTGDNSTQYITYIAITVEYETASLTSPGTPTIEQDEATGLYSVSWASASGTNGSGNIEYRLVTSFDEFYVGTSTEWKDAIPPSYGEQEWFQVTATYSGITTYSGYAYMTFQAPTLTAPTLSISPDSGSSATLSWYKPTVSYGELDNCDYFVIYSTGSSSGIEYVSFTGSTDEFLTSNVTESWLSSTVGEGNSVAFQLITIAYLNNTTSDYESLVDIGSNVFFTYDGANTIGYYTGTSWQPCTVHYYTGTEWKECIPYYYNGTQWVELKI